MQLHAAAAADQAHIHHTTGQNEHARATAKAHAEKRVHVICAGVCNKVGQSCAPLSVLFSFSSSAPREDAETRRSTKERKMSFCHEKVSQGKERMSRPCCVE